MKPTLSKVPPKTIFSLVCNEDGVRAIYTALGKVCRTDHGNQSEADAGSDIYGLLDDEFYVK